MTLPLYWDKPNPEKVAAGFPVWDQYSQAQCEKENLAARRISARFEVKARSRQFYHPPAWVKQRFQEVTAFWFHEVEATLGVRCIPYDRPGEPYLTVEEMARDCRDNHRHLMRNRRSGPIAGHCMMQFRAVHDIYGHCLQDAPFTFSGEVLAYAKFVKQYPPECWPTGFNNIVAENTYRLVHGQFLCINVQCGSPFVFDEEMFGCSQAEWEARYPAPLSVDVNPLWKRGD